MAPSAPFNITAGRKLTFIEKDVLFMPGPADYTVESLEMEKFAEEGCNFRSKSKRMKDSNTSVGTHVSISAGNVLNKLPK